MEQNKLRRVVITGMGIVSCIGNTLADVTKSLKESTSGITFSPDYQEHGFRSRVHGKPDIDLDALVDRRARRFMGDGAAYGYVAMKDAINDAGLSDDMVSNERTGIVVGSGGPSTSNLINAADINRESGSTKKIGPFIVPRAMSSTLSACLATPFHIKGMNYSISSACATSSHCIGNAFEAIQWGKQDIVFAGGGEEVHWTQSNLFDAMGAMSSKYNDTPQTASRAYDADRDGFVIAGGAGMLVLEELEHAKARGAKIYAEITGYGATSDGEDMVAPNGIGAERCMLKALATVPADKPVTYINTHGTSTPVGDIVELEAIARVFSQLGIAIPDLSSTKSLTGHSLGATGAQEAIYCLLMMREKFTAASANIINLDPKMQDFPIVRILKEGVEHMTALSNSFGFGGTNASLAFSTYKE